MHLQAILSELSLNFNYRPSASQLFACILQPDLKTPKSVDLLSHFFASRPLHFCNVEYGYALFLLGNFSLSQLLSK